LLCVAGIATMPRRGGSAALQHDLTPVTRNIKDFTGLDVQLINPWDAQDA
jgi:hypothetical protein